MDERRIGVDEAKRLIERGEGHFWDWKSRRSDGKAVQKIATAFANADGGEFIVGVEDKKVTTGLDRWQGFDDLESGNYIVEALARDIDPPLPYSCEWLSIDSQPQRGIACLVTVRKSSEVHETASGTAYVRRNTSSTALQPSQRTDLLLSKGSKSFESHELLGYTDDELISEPELLKFLGSISPRTEPLEFVQKQRLTDRSTHGVKLAAAVLFADSPSAVSPKRCAVKVARYDTSVENPERKHLVGDPITIEGPARTLIDGAIESVRELIENAKLLDASGALVPLKYPPEALKEVIANAVIHRDYNVSDDILITVFNNRVVVRSPGRLPGHMTLDNLLTDRFSRNPMINRIINKYPDPPNKDIGEGLKTLMRTMAEAKLKAPDFRLEGNYFIVEIRHTPLARPHDLVLEYLQTHDEITNSIGRKLTGINSENSMKDVFLKLAKAGQLERVPEKRGNKSAWRRPSAPEKGHAERIERAAAGSLDGSASSRMKFRRLKRR